MSSSPYTRASEIMGKVDIAQVRKIVTLSLAGVFAPMLDEASAAIEEVAAFVRARLGGP